MADGSKIGSIYYDVEFSTGKLLAGEKKATASMDRVGSSATKAAAAVTAAFAGIALGTFVDKLVKVQRQFDILNAGLITATGSVDAAGKAFEQLQKFAATTPYSIDQAVTAFTRLTNLGLDPSIKSLTAYGNTASAMGKDMMQMVEAVADASTGEFERLKEFGIRASKEGDNVSLTFKGVTETVKFSAENIQSYLLKLSETNFGGAMEQRAKTLDGAISNLSDSWDQLFLTISKSGAGEEIARGIRMATTAIGELERSIEAGTLTSYFDEALPYIRAMELAGTTLAAVYAGKFVSAMTASSAATISAVLAKRAALAEAVKLTTAELAQAQAAARVASASAAMGGSSAAAAAAQARLATATAAATAAQTAFARSATAAGLAMRGAGAVLTAMGGWVGVAVTALTLLAFNWDKVSGAAESAADISEQAADRIRKALSGASKAPMRDLIDGMGKAQKDLAAIDEQLKKGTKTELVGPRDTERQRALTKDEIASLTERREALRGAVVDYQKARNDLKESQMAGLFPDDPPAPKKGGGEGGGTTTAKGEKFDAQGYISDLVIANAEGLAKIDAQEQESLARANELLNEKKISQQQYEQAVTLIAIAAEKDREDIRKKDRDDLQSWLDEQLQMEEEAANKRQEAFESARSTVDPIGALKAEYDAKLALFDEYNAQLLERGIVAETDQQAARAAITAEYDKQRMAMQEQIFASQSEANAFLMDSLNALTGTTTSAITGLIDGTMTGKDAMIELGRTIRDQALNTLVEMGIQYVKNAIIAKTTTAATTAAQTAAIATVTSAEIAGTAASTAAATTSAATIATAAAPAAALTSVASFGSAAVIGLGALAATMAAAKAFGGGRQYGGAVNSDSFYRVNETGAPEMFTASNGRQYMMPNTKGEVTAANKVGGGVSIIINNYAGADVSASQNQNGDTEIVIQRAVAAVAEQIGNNSGVVWSAMKGATNVQSKL